VHPCRRCPATSEYPSNEPHDARRKPDTGTRKFADQIFRKPQYSRRGLMDGCRAYIDISIGERGRAVFGPGYGITFDLF
jgi:hypothetical protein